MAGAASALLGFIQMSLAALVGIAVGHFTDGTALAAVGLGALLSYLALVRGRADSDDSGTVER